MSERDTEAGVLMKLSYSNSQVFSVSAQFSIKQRKFAWLLRKHPKAFKKTNGADWHFTHHHQLSEPGVDLELFKEAMEHQMMNALKGMQVYHAEKRKLGLTA